MKALVLGRHMIPVAFALCSGAASLYWHFKFEARIPAAIAKVEKLQIGLRALECTGVNKDVILAIARESVEQDQRFAELFLVAGFLFLGIAATSFAFGKPASASGDPAPVQSSR